MSDCLLSTGEVSRMLGIPQHRIRYAHEVGLLPEPVRIGSHRAYAPADVERLKSYFSERHEDERS